MRTNSSAYTQCPGMIVRLAILGTGNALVINATPGAASLEVAPGIGAAAFAAKVLADVANANKERHDRHPGHTAPGDPAG